MSPSSARRTRVWRTKLLASATVAVSVIVACATAAGSPAHAAVAAAHGATGPSPTTQTTIRTKRVHAPGTYSVVVTLAPTKANESVDVYAGSQAQTNVSLTPAEGASLAFTVRARASKLAVRVVSHGAAAKFTLASALQTTPPVTPPAVTVSGSTSPTGPPAAPYNTLVWSDEFTGAAGTPPNPLDWTADSGGGCGPGTLSTNTTAVANAQLDGGGHLAITATGAATGYTTAQIDTSGLFSFTYGRIAARIDVPPGRGLCSAFWLLADDGEALGWPNGGEMDVMESIGNLPQQSNGFLHGPIAAVYNDQQFGHTVTSATPLAGGYHTYALTWQENSLTWSLDGVPFARATPATLPSTAKWVYNGHPFHIVLDLAVGGWPGNPDASTLFPATMSVDWVRVYQ
jgi:beta-glucanase (GH16 family)